MRHLFRVAASLDSLIVGEGQIAGQVKKAYELATTRGSVGPLLHALFQHARQVAKRVRTETGIARGHVSVSSVAVDYVRQVFDHFGDKTILVIGAGKMGELTLRHLKELQPQRILVTNRSPEKAADRGRGLRRRGGAVGATRRRAGPGRHRPEHDRRAGADRDAGSATARSTPGGRRGPVVILDIAVPRDFDPRIHDGDRTCLFNIDDLKRIREATLAGPAEARRAGRGDRRAGSAEVPQGLGPPATWPSHCPPDPGVRGEAPADREAAAESAQRPLDGGGQKRH